QVIGDDHLIINLASKEYAKCITNYLQDGDKLIEIVFGEMKNGKLITKATKAKMARGEMVRYMALNQITDINLLKEFQEIGFVYNEDLSTDTKYVFTC
ncbi:peroxide stress protein YaaA, partial [Intestinibaculum porci]|uniref:peroxide stress protein YaaA n=1 Tax=Intestinibaculum porci TaxID=2487118 RepID=UPI0024095994